MKRRKLSPTIMHLPSEIIVDIILKLPIKGIISCKFVCKAWRDLISSPGFVKLHTAQAKVGLLLKCTNICSGNNLRLIDHDELENLRGNGFNLARCGCDAEQKRCNECRMATNMNSLRTLTLCNARFELILKDKIRKEIYKPEEYKIVNSCRGLICLAKPNFSVASEQLAVCNPITGEFMYLPKLSDYEKYKADAGSYFYVFGLGFSPKTNQFKVIMMQFARFPGPVLSRCDILTVGTNSWKRISDFGRPCSAADNCNRQSLNFPTYIDGTLYWLIDNTNYSNCIFSFDFDESKFRSYSLPPNKHGWSPLGRPILTMGVLGGCLCVRDEYYYRRKICIDVWILRKHDGAWKRWNVLYSVGNYNGFPYNDLALKGSAFHLFRPMSSFSRPLIMFQYHPESTLMYFDGGFAKFKRLDMKRYAIEFEVVAHTPSFVSLKDIVRQERIKVINLKSTEEQSKAWSGK